MSGEFENIDPNEERLIVLQALDSFEEEKGGYRSMTDEEKESYQELLESQMTPGELERSMRISANLRDRIPTIAQELGLSIPEVIEMVKEELSKY